ncbi:MAG TPA: GNAT family N-acetyltransferase [Myxococcales bacterium]|jgi:carbonic anhydrase
MDEVRELFQEYAASLEVDLCFQGFQKELASLPGDYASPGGTLLVARVDGALAGCVALRQLEPGTGEMKRLYLRPQHRGLGLGACLVGAVIAASRGRGHTRLRLDTLPSMADAIRLYRHFGFTEIAPYRPNPVLGALFFELDLSRGAGRPVVRENVEHYVWGEQNDGWRLVRSEGLSVIQEQMRPGTSEVRHLHRKARQFFFILSGRASFEVAGVTHPLEAGQGMEVAPCVPHRFFNPGPEELRFLVVSAPPSHGDRILMVQD